MPGNELFELVENNEITTYDIDTSLIYASGEGDLNKVEQLLREKVDVNLRNYDGESALLKACLGGYFEIAQKLIDNGADINLKDYDDIDPFEQTNNSYELFFKTPLMRCVDENNIEATQFLIDNGANIDLQEYQGKTALMIAAKNANNKIVKLLLDHNADVNLRDIGQEDADGSLPWGEQNALFYAITEGNVETVKLLKEKNSSEQLIAQDKYKGRTLLMFASEYGNLEVVKYLLETMNLGMYTIEQQDNSWKTPLIYASSKGHNKIVELLIEHDDINYQDKEARTALMHACHNHHFVTAKFLLSNGADENIKDIRGYSIVDSRDENIKYFFSHLKKHNPKSLATDLKKFSSSDKLRYTNHPLNHEILTYDKFMHDLKEGWEEIKDSIEELSESLYQDISRLLFSDDENTKGWSSEIIKQDFKNGNLSSSNITSLQNRIKSLIVVKPDDELNLIDRFTKVMENLDLKIDVDLDYLGENEIGEKFFTDTKKLEDALRIILLDINERSSVSNKVFVECDKIEEEDIDMIELRIIHDNSDALTTVKKLKNTIKDNGGDFKSIYENLTSVCNWSIDTTISNVNKKSNKRYKIDYLYPEIDNNEAHATKIEDDSRGFIHILRFYI